MQSSNDFFPCFQGRTWRPDAEVRNDLESNLVVLRLDSPHPRRASNSWGCALQHIHLVQHSVGAIAETEPDSKMPVAANAALHTPRNWMLSMFGAGLGFRDEKAQVEKRKSAHCVSVNYWSLKMGQQPALGSHPCIGATRENVNSVRAP